MIERCDGCGKRRLPLVFTITNPDNRKEVMKRCLEELVMVAGNALKGGDEESIHDGLLAVEGRLEEVLGQDCECDL